MAEALLKHRAANKFAVFSAGTNPEKIDVRAVKALAKLGIEGQSLTTNHINNYKGKTFDYVITLCDKANTECRDFSGAHHQLAWDFPDPKLRSGEAPFIQTLQEINDRLTMFLLVETSEKISLSKEQEVVEQAIQQTLIKPVAFYKALSDDIRLKTLMLTHYHGELCVCELMAGLAQDSQPKVSRNLAVLKKCNILTARKHGQWVFYRINPKLPLWAKSVIAQTTENNIPLIKQPLIRLAQMKNRPSKVDFCKSC